MGAVTVKGNLNGKHVVYTAEIEGVHSSHRDLPVHRMAEKYQIKELELNDNGTYCSNVKELNSFYTLFWHVRRTP